MSVLFDEFKNICLHLNKVGITPTLMGSLGLEFISREDWEPSDIDIHVPGDSRGWEAPDELRIYDWDKIMTVMKELGYDLVDIHEHEFRKNRISVEYGSIDSLYDFAGISESEMELTQEGEIKFRVPSLEQFLSIYEASSKDSYRNDHNNNKDFKKIAWLNSNLSKRNSGCLQSDAIKNQDRIAIVKKFYEKIDEDKRLETSRQGQLEYFVTMNYIHKFAEEGNRILEIGAGTGRYSISLARDGFHVSAIELVERNLKELKNNAKGVTNLEACQGDALDLSRFDDDSFHTTLLLGPMYHIYDKKDQHKALDEAIRVTKPGGVIFAAFLSVHAIICTNYLYDYLPTTVGIKQNFGSDYRVKHYKEQLFTGFDICEFEELFFNKDVEYITTVAVDNILEVAEARPDFEMTDEDFLAFADYQLHICEKREMLGNSSHLLYICRKK